MSRAWIALLIACLACSGTEVLAQGRCQHGGSPSLATPYLGGATLANPLYQQAYMQQYYLQQLAYQQQAYSQQATMAQNQLAREEEQARQAKLAKRDERRAAERDRREAAKERVRQKNAAARLAAGK